MGRVILVNLMFTLIMLAFYGTTYVAQFSLAIATILLIALLLVIFLYLGAVAAYVRGIDDFRPPEIKYFFQVVKSNWKSSLTGGLFFSAVLFLTVLGMRFYSSLGGIMGMIGAIFLFWIFVTVILASLYYFPVTNRLDSTLVKMIKKSFLIFLDNPFVTIGVLIGLIFNVIFSLVTVFLIPGPAGALIWLDNNLKILIYKYDYLEKNPDAGRKIPWRALFLDDNEKIGPRTFRNTIFPWK